MSLFPPLVALDAAGCQASADTHTHTPAVPDWEVGTWLCDVCVAVVHARDREAAGVQTKEEVRFALLQAHDALATNTHSADSVAGTTPPRCVAIVTSECCRGGGAHAPPCPRCALVIAASGRPTDQPRPNVVGMYAVDLEDDCDRTASKPRPIIRSLPSWDSSTWDVVCNLAHTWFLGP